MSTPAERGSFEEHVVNDTRIRLAVRQSPSGMVGVWGNWGEQIPRTQLVDLIVAETDATEKDFQGDTGFTEIWHEPHGMTRAQSIDKQLDALDTLVQRTLDVNQIRADEVRGLSFATGVPLIGKDGIKGDSVVDFVADRHGFTNLTYRSETFAACASGEFERRKLLQHPELYGQPVMPIAFEPVTSIVPFDKNRADPLSMSLFGDGMAATIIYPGVDLTLEESFSDVVQDINGVLTAHMTYEHVIDWDAVFAEEPQIWQKSEDGKSEWIVGGKPPEGMLINMVPGETGVFFKGMAINAQMKLDEKHKVRHKVDGKKRKLVFAHHPNKTINLNVLKNLQRRGVEDTEETIPWVVFTGNSSAATSSIAFTELLPQMEIGDIVEGLAYGAGGSVVAYTAEVGTRWTHQEVPHRTIHPVIPLDEAA